MPSSPDSPDSPDSPFLLEHIDSDHGCPDLFLIIKTVGADRAAIGTDFGGMTNPPNNLKEPSDLPKLTQVLLTRGLNDVQIRTILGENALHVLHDGWRKKE
ncbi:MAG: membrane dipeptidase [Candidatus Sedimenticola sp. (ex Thyasira tokunagai)]